MFLKSNFFGRPILCLVILIAKLISHSTILNPEVADRMGKVEALSAALHDLPASHYETLKYLMGHLYRYVQCYGWCI